MQKLLKSTAALVAAILLIGTMAGCAQTEALDMKTVTAVIDVRTADEFASGHLQDAVNIDVESADFATKIEALDKAGNYVVYCHSGRRAGIAVDAMKAAGFTGTLTNAGGIADATTTTGLPVVTN